MGKFIINGGNKLYGSIKIERSKNAVLPMLAGALLTEEQVFIEDCPKIADVVSMTKILNTLGVKTTFCGDGLLVDSSSLNSYTLPSDLSKELRSSIFLMGALISRAKKAVVALPGGCNIGLRPIDIHISSLSKMGVDFTRLEEGFFCCAENLKSANIKFPYPSVGATENVIMASVLTNGVTTIEGAAKEPEIVDFINFLNSMGAKIYGGGSNVITIYGVEKLHGTSYKPMFDRIEACTYLFAGLIAGCKMEIIGADYKNILAFKDKFLNSTCKIVGNNDIINIDSGKERGSFSIQTGPYPQFPTDLQPQAMAYLTVSKGVSTIKETVFENRFKHALELNKMGANISIKNNTAIIKGVSGLKGAKVRSSDLRAGASLVLAGLVAEGRTEVLDIFHIERGYLDMEIKLRNLGADIKKVEK